MSVWNEEDPEEPRLVTDKIEVTPMMRTCLAFSLDDKYSYRPSKPWDDKKVKY